MKLPIPNFFSKKDPKEYFLALLLRDETITALVFEELHGKIQIIGKSDQHITHSIHSIENDDLLKIMDNVISSAENPLPPNIETHKTLFGVKESWVENSKIKKEYLAKLKVLSDALALEPLGFIVITEAIMHYLQKEEGAPVSAIFVEVGKRTVTATVIRAGRIIETHTQVIHESPVKTTDILLKEFELTQTFPARIILYTEEKDEHIIQEFITHTWTKNLFYHMPQITKLPKDLDTQAILLGAASQMGYEVHSNYHPVIPEYKAGEIINESAVPSETLTSDTDDIQPEKIDNSTQIEEFGFIQGKDIATAQNPDLDEKKHAQEEIREEIETTADIAPSYVMDSKRDNFDFVEEPKFATQVSQVNHPQEQEVIHSEKSTEYSSEKKRFPTFSLPSFNFSLPKSKKIVFIPPIILGVLILFVILYISSLKSTVTITIQPRILDQREDIVLSSSKGTNFNDKIIAGEVKTISETGSVTTSATGKKETGDKAKGTVTLYSRLTQQKTFPAGTIITSSNDIDFVLDKDVTVASASADASAGPSTAKVAVTAREFGKEANLPSNTRFDVGTYDSTEVIAKNDSAFSGGSKKEVTVVSRADIDKLNDEIIAKLQPQAQKQFNNQAAGDTAFAPTSIDATVTKKKFDKDVGEEAKTVKLDATVSFSALAYSETEMNEFAKEIVESEVKDPKISIDKDLEITLANAKSQNEDDLSAELRIKALLVPSLEEEIIKKEITGKSFEQAQEYIKHIPQVQTTEIILTPNLPFLPKILSQQSNNITLVIKKDNPQ